MCMEAAEEESEEEIEEAKEGGVVVIVSLRAISSLLTRRFWPVGNPGAQAVSSLGIGIQKPPLRVSGGEVRTFFPHPGESPFHPKSRIEGFVLHSRLMFLIAIQRDLSVGDGVSSAASMGAFVGLVATALYLNKNTQNSGIKLPRLYSSSIVLLHV